MDFTVQEEFSSYCFVKKSKIAGIFSKRCYVLLEQSSLDYFKHFFFVCVICVWRRVGLTAPVYSLRGSQSSSQGWVACCAIYLVIAHTHCNVCAAYMIILLSRTIRLITGVGRSWEKHSLCQLVC